MAKEVLQRFLLSAEEPPSEGAHVEWFQTQFEVRTVFNIFYCANIFSSIDISLGAFFCYIIMQLGIEEPFLWVCVSIYYALKH